VYPTAIIRDFYYKFRHLPIFLRIQVGAQPPQSNIATSILSADPFQNPSATVLK